MIERYEELRGYLPGLQKDMPEFYGKLAEIFEHQVFELHLGEERGRKTDFYIPYMMNDALECYLVLRDAWMTGDYLELDPEEYPIQGQLAWRDDKSALIVKQGKENVFTIWFAELTEVFQCYQYHRIGHFWVQGQEQWRQLVYMVGTVYEKYQYLGDAACNTEEQAFMRLIEFSPFRYWSPVGESLDDRYPSTREGALCMRELALEAGDKRYARLAGLYGRFPVGFLKKKLARRLCDPGRQALYELLYEKIRRASLAYPKRVYGEPLDGQILRERKQVHHRLHGAGFEIAMESNGTRPAPDGIDWLTISPKQQFLGEAARPVVRRCNELKCLFDGRTPVTDFGIEADYYYLQPCDMGGGPADERNRRITEACIDYILSHPRWRLSLQTHKLTGIK